MADPANASDRGDRPDIPGYTLGTLLGRGGSAQVWSAVRTGDRERLAVKVLRPGPECIDEAVREATVLRRVSHDHVLPIRDVVVVPVPGSDPRLALVLELAEGGSLSGLVSARGHLSTGEVVTVLSPVAAAMGDLHERGVVHADLSPGNVVFTGDGRPMVADLGVAQIVGEGAESLHGTAGFVAPELLDGAIAGPASDVYALGGLAWYCLTGEPPAPSALREPLEVLVPGTPEDVVEVIARALAVDPAARPSAGELATTLFDAAQAQPVVLSPGVDPAAGITYRIRSGADGARGVSDDGVQPRRRVRTAVAVAVAAGVLLGGGIGVGARWWQAAQGGLAAAATPAAPGVDLEAAASGVDITSPGGGRATAPLWRSQVRARSEVARPTPRSTPQRSTGGSGAELLRRRSAARRTPSRVLTALVDGRAAAWRRGSPARLTIALAPGSPALERDRADLGRVRDAQARYAGLSFTVRDPEVLPAQDDTGQDDTGQDDKVRIRALVRRSAYRLVRAGSTAVPTARGEPRRTVFELTWTPSGWRIADWQ